MNREKLTYNQILDYVKKAAKEAVLSEYDKTSGEKEVYMFAYGELDWPGEIGEPVSVEQEGGEGQGETWYQVYHWPFDDVYIRIDGFYTSYEGTSFDGWSDVKEVRPTQKTITVYK